MPVCLSCGRDVREFNSHCDNCSPGRPKRTPLVGILKALSAATLFAGIAMAVFAGVDGGLTRGVPSVLFWLIAGTIQSVVLWALAVVLEVSLSTRESVWKLRQ
jgi:hypothetical protein